jgi:hypothetical protein
VDIAEKVIGLSVSYAIAQCRGALVERINITIIVTLVIARRSLLKNQSLSLK